MTQLPMTLIEVGGHFCCVKPLQYP